MTRINVYDRSEEQAGLLGWFNRDTCTETVSENKRWDGENHRGVMSGMQIGYEELLRTARGRWVRHYDGHSEFNGPEFYEFLTDDEAKQWLIRDNGSESNEVLERYFGEPEEETGPSKGGRPAVGLPISMAFSKDLLARIDAAAKRSGLSRAAWLRQIAAAAVSVSEQRAEAGV